MTKITLSIGENRQSGFGMCSKFIIFDSKLISPPVTTIQNFMVSLVDFCYLKVKVRFNEILLRFNVVGKIMKKILPI